jgi:hypothetical protein
VLGVDAPARVIRGQVVTVRIYTDVAARAALQGVVFYVQGAGSHLVSGGVTTQPAPVGAPGPEFVDLPVTLEPEGIPSGKGFTVQLGLLDLDGNVGSYGTWDVTVGNEAPLSCPEQEACQARTCGLDPLCGIQCGDCEPGFACSYAGACEPQQGGGTDTATTAGTDTDAACPADADCSGRTCGPDPVCGVSCGDCDAGFVCTFAGQCEVDPGSTTGSTTAASTTDTSTTSSTTDAPTTAATSTTGQPTAPPTADAGADRQVFARDAVRLDGTGTTEPDGDALTYAWVQMTGAPVTLLDADAPQPSFRAPAVGSPTALEFQLTVTDPDGSSTDTVVVTVDAWTGEPVTNTTHPFELVASRATLDGQTRTTVDLQLVRDDVLLTLLSSDSFYGGASQLRAYDPEALEDGARLYDLDLNGCFSARHLAVAGDFAVTACDNGTMQVIDVGDFVGGPIVNPAMSVTGTLNITAPIGALVVAPALTHAFYVDANSQANSNRVFTVALGDATTFGCMSNCVAPAIVDGADVPGIPAALAITGNTVVVGSRTVFDAQSNPIDGGVYLYDATDILAGTGGAPPLLPLGAFVNNREVTGVAAIGNYVFFGHHGQPIDFDGEVTALDVSDPLNPVPLPAASFLPLARPTGMRLDGDTLVVTTEYGAELYDVSSFASGAGDRAAPVRTGLFPVGRFQARATASAGRVAVLGDRNNPARGAIASLARIADPGLLAGRRLGPFGTIGDVELRGEVVLATLGVLTAEPNLYSLDASGAGELADVTAPVAAGDVDRFDVRGDRLVAGDAEAGLSLWDLTGLDSAAPAGPALLGSYDDGLGTTVRRDAVLLGPDLIAYVTDSPAAGSVEAVQLLDASEPTNIVPVAGGAGGRWEDPTFLRSGGLCASPAGDRLVVLGDTAGSAVLDVSDPATPTAVELLPYVANDGAAAGCALSSDRAAFSFGGRAIGAGFFDPAAAAPPAVGPLTTLAKEAPWSYGITSPNVRGDLVLDGSDDLGLAIIDIDVETGAAFLAGAWHPGGPVLATRLVDDRIVVGTGSGSVVMRTLDRVDVTLNSPVVAQGQPLTVTAQWSPGLPAEAYTCRRSGGAPCAFAGFDGPSRTVTFTLDTTATTGDEEVAVFVGSETVFASGRARFRITP